MQFTDNSGQVMSAMERNIGKTLTELGIKWQENVTAEITANKWDWPRGESPRDIVDTGRLRASMTYSVNIGKKEVVVGTNVEYAQDVEYGKYGKPARPFMKASGENYKDDYEQILKDNLGVGFN